MKTTSIVTTLIENIKTDQTLLTDIDTKINEAKDEKREISDRLKDYRKDVTVLLKYASEKEQQQLADLGFDFSESERGLNPVAPLVLDILMKAKDNKLTNAQLYDAYVATFKNKEDAYNYTEFNIKCRSLFNTQRLIRTKGKDAKSSREDIISLNGRVVKDKPETQKTKTDGK